VVSSEFRTSQFRQNFGRHKIFGHTQGRHNFGRLVSVSPSLWMSTRTWTWTWRGRSFLSKRDKTRTWIRNHNLRNSPLLSVRERYSAADTSSPLTGLRGRFSVFAAQKHRYLRRSQKREIFTTPLSPVKLPPAPHCPQHRPPSPPTDPAASIISHCPLQRHCR
jgi:hypothetical protein